MVNNLENEIIIENIVNNESNENGINDDNIGRSVKKSLCGVILQYQYEGYSIVFEENEKAPILAIIICVYWWRKYLMYWLMCGWRNIRIIIEVMKAVF